MRFWDGMGVMDGNGMRRVCVWGLAVAMAGTISAKALAQETPAPVPTDGASPKAVCDEPTFDCKEVWTGEKVEHAFIIRNTGDAVLNITEVRAGCGCTATEYDKTIEPGQTGKVKAVLSTSGIRTRFSKPVYVGTNDPHNARITLTLQGVAKPRVVLTPPNGADFGRVGIDAVDPIKVRLTNNTDEPMKIELLDPTAQHAVFKAAVEEIEAGKVYEVTITPQRPFAVGSNVVLLHVRTGLEDEPQIPIACKLFSPAILEVTPGSIMLGVPPNRDMERKIQLRYNGRGEMKILSAVASDPSVPVEIKELTAGRDYEATVTLPAGLAISPERPIEIKIATDYESRPEVIIPITMRAGPQQGVVAVLESLVGKAAPTASLALATAPGTISLGGSGKVMAINFWVSWGQDSSRQLPMINRLAQAYGRRGVEFVMVSGDDMRTSQEVVQKARQLGVNLPIGVDAGRQVSSQYGVDRWPLLVLVGKSGTIEAAHRGIGRTPEAVAALEAKIESELDTLIAGKTRHEFPAPAVLPSSTTAGDQAEMPLPAIAAPLLVVESLRQDVGLHKPGEQVEYVLYVKNVGQRLLQVSKVTASEGVELDSTEIASLETAVQGRLRVKFQAPKEPGPFGKTVTIESNDQRRPSPTIALAGTVRPYIEVDPPAGVDFSRTPRLHSMPRLATLAYNGEGEVKYLKVESSSPRFKASVDPIPNTPYAKVTVQSEPPFEPGANEATIRITTDCPQQSLVTLPVKLFVPPRIEVMPAELILPQVSRLQQNMVQILNNGEQPLSVLGVVRSNDRILTQFAPSSDGTSYELHVTVPAGYKSPDGGDKITIRTDDSEHPEIVIPIRSTAGPVSQR